MENSFIKLQGAKLTYKKVPFLYTNNDLFEKESKTDPIHNSLIGPERKISRKSHALSLCLYLWLSPRSIFVHQGIYQLVMIPGREIANGI